MLTGNRLGVAAVSGAMVLLAVWVALRGDRSAGADPRPATRPATLPVDLHRVAQLVAQLGADAFQDRERAGEELAKIGREAVPALKKAMQSGDAEVATRAERLLQRIEENADREPIGPAGRVVHEWVTVRGDRGRGSITAHNPKAGAVEMVRVNEEQGYRVAMFRDREGIRVTLSALVDGREVKEDYAAASEVELKARLPELHAVHDALIMGLNSTGSMRAWWRQFARPPEGPQAAAGRP